jgi:hypothetical protein
MRGLVKHGIFDLYPKIAPRHIDIDEIALYECDASATGTT